MAMAINPSGCESNDAVISPRNKSEIDLPNPQPGQKSSPTLLKTQKVKWELLSGEMNIRIIRPRIHTTASSGKYFNRIKKRINTFFLRFSKIYFQNDFPS